METDIAGIKEAIKEKSPKDILRVSYIHTLEDDVIQKGFPELLQDAYDSVLTLSEYIIFIGNAYLFREYGIIVPTDIDWKRVYSGINHRFEIILDTTDDEQIFSYLDDDEDFKTRLNPAEKVAYDMIREFHKTRQIKYRNNERELIEALMTQGIDAFISNNKRYDVFSVEIADATAYCFDQCSQIDKYCFPEFFMKMWELPTCRKKIKTPESENGYKKLIELIENLKVQYLDAGRKIAAVHAEKLIDCIRSLINDLHSDEEEQSRMEIIKS